MNNKYLPKIADLISANTNDMQVQNKPKIEFVKCNKCNGEGFIKYWKIVPNGELPPIKYERVALCTCENAEKQRTINGYNLPSIAEIGL